MIIVESIEYPNQFYQTIPSTTGIKFIKWGPLETARQFKNLAEFKKEYLTHSQSDCGKDWFPINEPIRFRQTK